MKNELVKIELDQYGLQENKAKDIKNLYLPMIEMLSEMEDEFNHVISQEITKELIPVMRDLRLRISKIRTSADKARKEGKDEYLRACNAIQGAYNTFLFVAKSKEEKLGNREKHFENLEKERIEKLTLKREAELRQYCDEFETMPENLGTFQSDVWENYIAGKKRNYEERKEAERKAEEQRIEEQRIDMLTEKRINKLMPYWDFLPENYPELGRLNKSEWTAFYAEMQTAKQKHEKEQEQIRIENEKLKKEAEEKERLAEIERQKIEKERQLEREKAAKIQAELQAKAKKEAEEKERIQKELQAKKDAELKAENEAKAKEKAALLAPDKQKIIDFINQIKAIKRPDLKSEESRAIMVNIENLITKLADYGIQKANTL